MTHENDDIFFLQKSSITAAIVPDLFYYSENVDYKTIYSRIY